MLSYRLTTFMLLAFVSLHYILISFLQKLSICFIQMAMVTCPEWISGKGNFIDCMHGGSIADDVINRYCYIQVFEVLFQFVSRSLIFLLFYFFFVRELSLYHAMSLDGKATEKEEESAMGTTIHR